MDREEASKPNFRQAGRHPDGKLVKGFIQDPLNKTTSASIPYKFETILYKNTNPKGFGASAQRVGRNEDIAPGPGSYDYEHTYVRSNSTSYSKKGFGNGFVSQTNRLLYRGYINTGPGPGAYTTVDEPFRVTHIPHDAKREVTSELLKSRANQVDLPGPGYYNPQISKSSNISNTKVINSIFKSNTGRTDLISNSNPPPGTYEIDRSLADKKPFKHFLGSATFMLPTVKKSSKEIERKQVTNEFLGKNEEAPTLPPGPGHYFKLDKDDEMVLFNQKLQDKNSANFVVSNTTRFGEMVQHKVKRAEYPGPGTYAQEVVDNQERTLVSGAVFMSETARRPFKEVKNFVGPMKYNPELLPKKSYHLNINKIWV